MSAVCPKNPVRLAEHAVVRKRRQEILMMIGKLCQGHVVAPR